MKISCNTLLVISIFFFSMPASSHRFAPSILKASQIAVNEFNIVWKTPAQRVSGVPLQPVLPEFCRSVSASPVQLEGTGLISQWRIKCDFDEDGIVGQVLSVDGLAPNQASAILMLSLSDGREYQAVLDGTSPSFTVPREPDAQEIMFKYPLLGAEHIWEGPDHLLFVFGLLLLVGGGSRLIWTITSFTVGHSITLALVTLDLLAFPSDLAEFLIAVSIFVLALELSRGDQLGRLWRSPWWLAGGFGLLHGMGFAGALAETGLPQGQIPLALLFFNFGIEIGQLLFIGLVYFLWLATKRFISGREALLSPVPVYCLGGLSSMWCIQRAIEIIY